MSETQGTESSAEPKVPAMEVAIESVSDHERKLDVEIPWDEVKVRLDEAYNELKKGVTIKGFRKGKVPRSMLENLFGKHVVKEVAQRLVQESIPKALSDNEVTPVSEPKVDDQGINNGESFKYSAVMEILPEIVVKDYFDTEVKVRPGKVTDEAVEMALRFKQQENTAYKAVEGRETRDGDVLMVDVMGKLGDKPFDVEQQMVELGEHAREPVEGLAAKLTGIPADTEELDVELDVADPADETKVIRARLLVTVHEVRQKEVPELDDDFAKDTGEAETLDELKDVLRKKLLEEDEQRAQDEGKDLLIKTIVEKNEIPAVPALVERHLERRIALQKALMGMEMGGAAPQGLDEQALKDHMRGEAEDAVKRGLLLSAVGKQEKVEVQEADVEKKLAEIASSRNQNVARVRSEYEKEGLLDSLKERLVEDKTLDLLMSKANIIIEEKAEAAEVDQADEAAEKTESGE